MGARKEHGLQVLQLAKDRQQEVERILRSVIVSYLIDDK
jgi:hypothetical protein